MSILLRLENLRHHWPDRRQEIRLTGPVEVWPGDCHVLVGPSGSGKSTVLLAAAGLLDSGRAEGLVERFAACGPGGLGLVMQNPETQILSSQCLDEVKLGLLAAGVPDDEALSRSREALERAGMAEHADSPTDALSMGQKYRLCLAVLLAMRCPLWLLDEPLSQLDAPGRARLRELLAEHLAQGGAALFTAHRVPVLEGLDRLPICMDGDAQSFEPPAPRSFAEHPDGEELLAMEDICFGYEQGRPILDRLRFSLRAGERLAVSGENGAGKSTLAALVTGMIRPDCGRLRVAGQEKLSPNLLAGRVALLPQDPDFLLTEGGVLEEAAFSRVQLGLPEAERVALDWLRFLGLEHLAEAPPLSLSFGQKRLVSMASALAMEPRLLVLDEPFTGLDPLSSARLLAALDRFQDARRAAVLCLTHEREPHPALGARVLRLAGGRLA